VLLTGGLAPSPKVRLHCQKRVRLRAAILATYFVIYHVEAEYAEGAAGLLHSADTVSDIFAVDEISKLSSFVADAQAEYARAFARGMYVPTYLSSVSLPMRDHYV
jgi:hypothetical protein